MAYQYIGGAVLRAAVLPAGQRSEWPDIAGGSVTDVERWRQWLSEVSSPHVVEAIEVASPVLARQLHDVHRGRVHDVAGTRRAVLSVARYLLRMTGRATPFGFFAGVTPAEITTSPPASPCGAGGTTARWGTAHRPYTRPDPAWLVAAVRGLEACPQLLPRVAVVANTAVVVRDGRLVLLAPGDGDGPVEVSVRRTPTVAAALGLSAAPITVADLVAELAAGYPGDKARITELVSGLLSHGILISSLRAPMTAVDPLGHLVDSLGNLKADNAPSAAACVAELRAVRESLTIHDRTDAPEARAGLRARAVRHMSAVAPPGQTPLTVDLRLDATVKLPAVVAREAEKAADLLTRLNPPPQARAAWTDYRSRFLDRYGPGALVPVIDLVADAGLSYPAGFRGSPYTGAAPAFTERDRRLLALAQHAALDGTTEITLDDPLITNLTAGEPAAAIAPHTELSVQVHAPSAEAVDRGNFDLVIGAAFRAAGTTTGRFLHLLADTDFMARLGTLDPHAVLVQISSTPLLARTTDLARTPLVLPHLLPLGEHPTPGEQQVRVEDLAVSGDATGLHLIQVSSGRPVEVVAVHSVEFTNATHPLVRFLCEISHAHTAMCRPFDWGAASRLPFLPRLRHGRIIASPARWNLTTADLVPTDPSWTAWRDTFTAWAKTVRLPETIVVGGDDRRMRLDLNVDLHVRLLRAHLDRYGNATIHETPDPSAYGWNGGHAHELILPLAIQQSHPARPAKTPRPRLVSRGHGQLPGISTCLQAHLYIHPDRLEQILTCHLDRLICAWDTPPRWWYLPYRDPDPHLRLRIHLTHPDLYGQAVARVGHWAADLAHTGVLADLRLSTYRPETGRYGHHALTAAETVFAADSAAAITELQAAAVGPDRDALTAASLVDVAAATTGSSPAGFRWLITAIPHRPGPPQPRATHRATVALTGPHHTDAVRQMPGGPAVAEAWRTRREALAAYRAALPADRIDPLRVLPSLLHLHHIRTAGIDPDREERMLRLARAAALTWTTRTPAGTP